MNNQKKVLGYMLAIFLAGGVSGALIAAVAAKERIQPVPVKGRNPPTMRDVCDHMRSRLKSRLNLSEEQMQKVKPILDGTAKELEGIYQDNMRQIERVIENSNAKIEPLLDEEQKTKLKALEKDRRQFRHHDLRGKPPC